MVSTFKDLKKKVITMRESVVTISKSKESQGQRKLRERFHEHPWLWEHFRMCFLPFQAVLGSWGKTADV